MIPYHCAGQADHPCNAGLGCVIDVELWLLSAVRPIARAADPGLMQVYLSPLLPGSAQAWRNSPPHNPGRRMACSLGWVEETGRTVDPMSERARRRDARALIAAYHEEQLQLLLERVREGFGRLDAGEIDVFDLDELIHHYKRSAAELWKFCGSSGGAWLRAAQTLSFVREEGDEPDWWEAGSPRERRGRED